MNNYRTSITDCTMNLSGATGESTAKSYPAGAC